MPLFGKKKDDSEKPKKYPVQKSAYPTQQAYPAQQPAYQPQAAYAYPHGQPVAQPGAPQSGAYAYPQGQAPIQPVSANQAMSAPPPAGPPPPYSAQPGYGAPAGYPQGQGAPPSYPQAPQQQAYVQPASQTVVVQGGFEAGARFDKRNPPNIPPPPPGYAPNQAQQAQATGQNVVITQQKGNWATGGGDGGYTMW